jgi:hypothetical protein
MNTMRNSSPSLFLAPTLLAAALLAAGCATPDASLVGADRQAVEARVGANAVRFPLAGGGERWIHPAGGHQQQAWAVDFDAGGRVVSVTQVKTAENFGRVRIGADTQADILREFGRPRITQPFPLVGQVGWMYPYLENGIWNSEMVIYFDPQGIVQRIENGPDPRYIGGNGKRR